MNLGDVTKKVVPKMCLVAPPATKGGHIATRSFIPHECHSAIGVFAAVTVATAAVLPGSPADRVARLPEGRSKTLSVEHPTGEFSVRIEVGGTPEQARGRARRAPAHRARLVRRRDLCETVGVRKIRRQPARRRRGIIFQTERE